MVRIKKIVRHLRVNVPHNALPCENPSLANSEYRPDSVLDYLPFLLPLVLEDVNQPDSPLKALLGLHQVIMLVLPDSFAMPEQTVELDGKMLFRKIDIQLIWRNNIPAIFENGSIIYPLHESCNLLLAMRRATHRWIANRAQREPASTLVCTMPTMPMVFEFGSTLHASPHAFCTLHPYILLF